MTPSKLEQLANLVPATPLELAYWLLKVVDAGMDTLALILTSICAGYSMEDVDLLNELHIFIGANNIVHQMDILDGMGFEQQVAYQSQFELSPAAYFMLVNLSHCIGEFRQIKIYLEGLEK